ncbi:hypothetical protein BJ875DRAFT_278890 [Amylocarpus encephaloides]|uniref:Uncharacterized protein n=1 Tax=Amylocarpus encephaloides TaxID=45428 RepID=A0A9P7YKL0_9HELO|nr:hypothetical protein BJ875DRAFT_278890 [Amylocarpus encephaloides]
MDDHPHPQASATPDIKTLFEALAKSHDLSSPLSIRPPTCCRTHDGFQPISVRVPTYTGPAVQLADGRVFKGCVQLLGDPIVGDATDEDLEALLVSLCKELCEDHFANEISHPASYVETSKGFKEVYVFRDVYEGPGVQLDDGRLFKGGIDLGNLVPPWMETGIDAPVAPCLFPARAHSINGITTHPPLPERPESLGMHLPTRHRIPPTDRTIELAMNGSLGRSNSYSPEIPLLFCRRVDLDGKVHYHDCLNNEGSSKTHSCGMDLTIARYVKLASAPNLPFPRAQLPPEAYSRSGLASGYEHSQHNGTRSIKLPSMSELDDSISHVNSPRSHPTRTTLTKSNLDAQPVDLLGSLIGYVSGVKAHRYERTPDGRLAIVALLPGAEMYDGVAQTDEMLALKQSPPNATPKRPRSGCPSDMDAQEKFRLDGLDSLRTPPTAPTFRDRMAQLSELISKVRLSLRDNINSSNRGPSSASTVGREEESSPSPLPPRPAGTPFPPCDAEDLKLLDPLPLGASASTATPPAENKSRRSAPPPEQRAGRDEPVSMAWSEDKGRSHAHDAAVRFASSNEDLATNAAQARIDAPSPIVGHPPTLATLFTPYKLLHRTAHSVSWASAVEATHASLMASRASKDAGNRLDRSSTAVEASQLAAARKADDQRRWDAVLPAWFWNDAAYRVLEGEMAAALGAMGEGETTDEAVVKFLENEWKIREAMQEFVRELQRREGAGYY